MTRRAGPEVRLSGAGAGGRNSVVLGAGERSRGSRVPGPGRSRKLVGRRASATGWVSPGPHPHWVASSAASGRLGGTDRR